MWPAQSTLLRIREDFQLKQAWITFPSPFLLMPAETIRQDDGQSLYFAIQASMTLGFLDLETQPASDPNASFVPRASFVQTVCVALFNTRRYAWFNLLTVACALPLAFPPTSSSTTKRKASSLGSSRLNFLSLLYILVTIPFLVPTQWCSPGLLYWSSTTALVSPYLLLPLPPTLPPPP